MASDSRCVDYILSDFANHAGTVANIKTSPNVDKKYNFLLVSSTISGNRGIIFRPQDNFVKELIKRGYNGSCVLSPLGRAMKKDVNQLLKSEVIHGIVVYEANYHIETNVTTYLFENRPEVEETPAYEKEYCLDRWGKPMLKLNSFRYTHMGGEITKVDCFEEKVRKFLDNFFPIHPEPTGRDQHDHAIYTRGMGIDTGLVRRCLDNFRHYYNPVEYPFVFGCH